MRIKKVLFFTAVGLLATPVIALVLLVVGGMTYRYFTYSPVYENDIASLNLYFRTVRCDSTTKIFFGGKDNLDNYIEVSPSNDCMGNEFFFIINNADKPEVEQIIFEDGRYFDFHVRSYEYSINLHKNPRYTGEPTIMYDILRELPKIKDYSRIPHNRIIVHVWLKPYNKGIGYKIYDLSDEHYAQLLDEMLSNRGYVLFPQLLERGVDLSVGNMTSAYGNPFVHKKFNLTNDNKKDFIPLGWFFVDTLKVGKQGLPIEQFTWNTDEGETTIIYKVVNDTTYIPINGGYLRWYYKLKNNPNKIPWNGTYKHPSEIGKRILLK